jgi:peptidoglycan/LPS O-acetylase OafA/YrhL
MSADSRLGDFRNYDLRLESLRGVAALAVAALHAGSATLAVTDARPYLLDGGNTESPFWAILSQFVSLFLNSQGAVVLFFVLSGYVLRLSLDRAQGAAGPLAFRFISRRFLRLFPPVAVTVVVFALAYWTVGLSMVQLEEQQHLYSLTSLIKHAFLLDYRIDPVVWTLQIEVLAAPLILVLWFATRRFGPIVLWLAVFAGFGVSFSPGMNRWTAAALDFEFPLFSFFYAFVAGMIIVEWSRFAVRAKITKLGGFYPLFGALLIMLAPVLAVGSWRILLEVLGAAGLVTGVVLNLRGVVTWLLDLRLIRFYGRISYSFYLYHPLTIGVIYIDGTIPNALAATGAPAVVQVIAAFVLTTIVVTPLAVASYWLVEMPAMRLGKRFGSRRPLAASGEAGSAEQANRALIRSGGS